MCETRFSVLDYGYTTNNVTSTITVEDLADLIADNPDKEDIKALHSLDKTAEKARYNTIKGRLPCIKPHATFNKVGKTDNITSVTGYFYYDIDTEINREELIAAYGKHICVAGKSVGGKGMFFIVKASNPEHITTTNFNQCHSYIKETYFSKITTDSNATGIVRNFVIPFDENVFFNINNSVAIDFNDLEKCKVQYVDKDIIGCPLHFLRNPENIEFNKIRWVTKVDVNDPIVDVRKEEYVQLHVYDIPDGKKRVAFPRIVFKLMYLNPDFDFNRILAVMQWWNKEHTCNSPMLENKLYNLVKTAFDNYDAIKINSKTKRIWFNRTCGLNGDEKRDIAAAINGKLKSDASKHKIREAMIYFNEKGKKINVKAVAEHSGLSRVTVTKYFDELLLELNFEKKKCKDQHVDKDIIGCPLHFSIINKTEMEEFKPLDIFFSMRLTEVPDVDAVTIKFYEEQVRLCYMRNWNVDYVIHRAKEWPVSVKRIYELCGKRKIAYQIDVKP